METIVFFAQTCLTFYLAAWLLLGVRDNFMHPSMNLNSVAEVMRMDRMRDEYPNDYAQIAHRRLTSTALHRTVFAAIVFSESAVCLLLWSAVVWMVLANLGLAEPESARSAALGGALGFTTIWAAFLICGNHFAYWYCHEGMQNTHYQMTLWGIATMIFLSVG
jgi:predicted small integral membrane protein